MLRPMAEAEQPDAQPAEASEPVASGKRSKKRKKEAPPPKPLPGAGTPDGEKLREAVRAFEVGDYVRVRARVADLRKAEDPAIREVAQDLAARIAIDPVQVVVMLACAAVLAAIAYVWVIAPA